MPELNWIGKAAVIKHHKDVPFRLLETDSKLSCGDPGSGNLIVEGDNLYALKALSAMEELLKLAKYNSQQRWRIY